MELNPKDHESKVFCQDAGNRERIVSEVHKHLGRASVAEVRESTDVIDHFAVITVSGKVLVPKFRRKQ